MATTTIADPLERIEEHSSRVVRGAKDQRTGRDGQERFYTYYDTQGNEHVLPSVTTVLQVLAKPALIGWSTKTALEKAQREIQALQLGELGEDWLEKICKSASRYPDEVASTSALFGTRAHDYLSLLLCSDEDKGLMPAPADDLRPVVDGFLKWQDSVDIEICLTEVAVANPSAGYAGTIDAIGLDRETRKLVVLDWKTGNSIWPEAALQAAAYAGAVSEIVFEPVDSWVVRFLRDRPGHETKEVNSYAALEAFISANDTWKSMRSKKSLWKTEG